MGSRSSFDGIIKALEQLGYRRRPAVPVIGCRGSKACWRVRGDYWLAGRFEKNTLSRLIRRHFDVSLNLDNHHVVFHRIPAPTGEYAVEVFAHAVRIGVLEYGSKGWILHPSGALASVLASIGANYLQASSDKGRRLKGKKLRLGGEACNRKDWVLVGTSKWIGPAKVVDKEKCIVKIKDLAPLGFKPLSPSEIDEAVEANTEIIGALASEAREFIRRVYARFQASRGKLYVAFSGGADSTTLLELAREAVGGGNVVAVYVDTGMEHPETKAYVEKIVSIIGVDLEVVSAGLNPIELIAKRGFMTRDNRWCTRLLKLEPLKAFYEKHGVRLVLDGARKWESTTRAKTPRLGENPLIPGVMRALPIYHWPRLAVQLFLAERNLPVNQLYNEGLVRIGCIVCPAMHLYELHISYMIHKEWFHKLAEKIAENNNSDAKSVLITVLRGNWRYGNLE